MSANRCPVAMDSKQWRLCLGEQLESLDMLLVTAQPPEALLASLQKAYPALTGRTQTLEPMATDADFSALFSALGSDRWPLACLFQPCINKAQLTRLLARLRDLHADRVIHIDDTTQWSLADSLALGFSQRGNLADPVNSGDEPLQVYEFDLHCYKPAPDWLNARHWANPEQWDKHRW